MKTKLLAHLALLLTFSHFASDLPAAPFRIVVLGDSILWGQGLLEGDKIHSRVSQLLRECLGFDPNVTSVAHSGATIGFDDPSPGTPLHGEIPTKYPTVLKQCADFNNSPETVDLVLLDGGANDVNAGSGHPLSLDIVDPTVPIDALLERTQQRCHHDMTNLLDQASIKFARATIVVSGYFPIVSDQTPLALLVGALSIGFGIPAGTVGEVERQKIVAKSRRWAEQSAEQLRLSVQEANTINQSLGRSTRIVFADPRFGPANAMLANEPWLFTWKWLSPIGPFVPEDPVASDRIAECLAILHFPPCDWASMGHPNPRGAQAYAEAIFAAYLGTDGLVWVNFNPSCPTCGDGTEGNPFGNLAGGRDGVPKGGTILIKPGSTAEPISINKKCRLQACGGLVTIGRP